MPRFIGFLLLSPYILGSGTKYSTRMLLTHHAAFQSKPKVTEGRERTRSSGD